MAENRPCRIWVVLSPGQKVQAVTPMLANAVAALLGPIGWPSPGAFAGRAGELTMIRSDALYCRNAVARSMAHW